MSLKGCVLVAVCGMAGWMIGGWGMLQAAPADTPPAKASGSTSKAPRLAENLRPFDKNHDGKLDAAERRAYNASKKKGETAPAASADLDSALGRDKDGNKVAQPKSESSSASGGSTDKGRELYAELRKKFDKNGDGQLDETERAAMSAEVEKMRAAGTLPEGFGRGRSRGRGGPGGDRYAELRKKYDKNGDGELDESERAAMRASGEGFGGGRGGPGGGGSERFQAMIKRFDTDGDGQLDDSERAAMRAEFEKMRASGQFGGRRGGGNQ